MELEHGPVVRAGPSVAAFWVVPPGNVGQVPQRRLALPAVPVRHRASATHPRTRPGTHLR